MLDASTWLFRLPLVFLATAAVLGCSSLSADAKPQRLYAYASVGDNQWVTDWPPMDGKTTLDPMCDYLAQTHGIKRLYWRGESDRMALANWLVRKENPTYSDFWTTWLTHLTFTMKTNDAVVAAAKRNGMEIYIFDGLFEHAAQSDVGGCGMFLYQAEDKLRIEHPEWCPVDRWGERIASGPIEFCYPQARKIIIDRYVKQINQYGYDGVCFYTYVENMGVRYDDEFGYNEPIVKEFQERYGVDIRTQPFDKQAWYKLRGEYVTQFIREFHAALAKTGKKLSMTIQPDAEHFPATATGQAPTRAVNSHFPEPWYGTQTGMPGAGMIYLDWEQWVREGIVDELVCWWGGDKQALLTKMIEVCKGTPVELIVNQGPSYDDTWKPYFEAGVHPLATIVPDGGIDKFTLEATSLDALKSPDWRLRAQTLADIGKSSLTADPAAVAPLAADPHVLVRRQAIVALGELKATDQVPLIESKLTDPESSVRIQAVVALSKVNGPNSPAMILYALDRDGYHQMKLASIAALVAMKETALPRLVEGMESGDESVREVCVRALGQIGGEATVQPLLAALKGDKDYRIRFFAITGLAGVKTPEVVTAFQKALRDPEPTVQLWAAAKLGDMAASISPEQAKPALATLEGLFRQYGAGCKRDDASWGWRPVGNAILAFGQPGRDFLEAMRTQKKDKWLAWEAYLVIYVPQVPDKASLCEEKDAVETHAKYAPPFPGWR